MYINRHINKSCTQKQNLGKKPDAASRKKKINFSSKCSVHQDNTSGKKKENLSLGTQETLLLHAFPGHALFM